MRVCLADTDLQSVGATLINLVNGMNALVSIAKVDRTYKELLEVTYEWQQFYQEIREDLDKANAKIVQITAVGSNLFEASSECHSPLSPPLASPSGSCSCSPLGIEYISIRA